MLVDVPKKLDAFSSSPLATSMAFITKSPKEARGVFDALGEALTFIHTDKVGTLEIAKKRFANANAKVLETALARIENWYSTDGHFSHAHIGETQNIAVALKIMPQVFPYDDVVAPFARQDAK
jgi:hypothetical protein